MQQKQLQELRAFLASDHRAAADIGITSCEAQQLLSRRARSLCCTAFTGRGAARERSTADRGSFHTREFVKVPVQQHHFMLRCARDKP
jgi:hypothetical protein